VRELSNIHLKHSLLGVGNVPESVAHIISAPLSLSGHEDYLGLRSIDPADPLMEDLPSGAETGHSCGAVARSPQPFLSLNSLCLGLPWLTVTLHIVLTETSTTF
jgi:hypothetical protein